MIGKLKIDGVTVRTPGEVRALFAKAGGCVQIVNDPDDSFCYEVASFLDAVDNPANEISGNFDTYTLLAWEEEQERSEMSPA